MTEFPGSIKTPTIDEVESSFMQLTEAINSHRKWLAEWNTRIICGIYVEEQYASEESHKQCYFGRWFYGKRNNFLEQKPEFTGLEKQHRLVHEQMRNIVMKANRGESIARVEYDNFVRSDGAFTESLMNLRDDLFKLMLSFDYLTGAFNREAFFRILEQEHSRVKRFNEPACLVLLDIDRFKKINDHLGHTAGDRALASIANFIMENMRPYDSICRYGGEEFMICMPKTTVETSHHLIDRVREELSKKTIYDVSGTKRLNISASFGIAPLSANEELKDTIEHADKVLYHAKANGRNKVGVWPANA
ncbi:MAG: diguanylate cyclase [Proteobacteria bacterium]|nr:diguanylate cyclase [Pseudomonadota bacterium]MBU1739415.1 diguanylate cyclase [Pseudomonadota bacterium]